MGVPRTRGGLGDESGARTFFDDLPSAVAHGLQIVDAEPATDHADPRTAAVLEALRNPMAADNSDGASISIRAPDPRRREQGPAVLLCDRFALATLTA